MAIVQLRTYSGDLSSIGTTAEKLAAKLAGQSLPDSTPQGCAEAGGYITAAASIISALIPLAGPVVAAGVSLAGGAITSAVCGGGLQAVDSDELQAGAVALVDLYSGQDDYSV